MNNATGRIVTVKSGLRLVLSARQKIAKDEMDEILAQAQGGKLNTFQYSRLYKLIFDEANNLGYYPALRSQLPLKISLWPNGKEKQIYQEYTTKDFFKRINGYLD